MLIIMFAEGDQLHLYVSPAIECRLEALLKALAVILIKKISVGKQCNRMDPGPSIATSVCIDSVHLAQGTMNLFDVRYNGRLNSV